MITQAIRGWLRKLFAWWPWKQSSPVEYRRVPTSTSRGIAPEASAWPQREGTVPQSGVAPRLSTLENLSERAVSPASEVPELPPLSVQAQLTSKSAEHSGETFPSSVPTSQQRLEFLRYLVQRGIVNEGFEEKE